MFSNSTSSLNNRARANSNSSLFEEEKFEPLVGLADETFDLISILVQLGSWHISVENVFVSLGDFVGL
jgi:hypothetical protein